MFFKFCKPNIVEHNIGFAPNLPVSIIGNADAARLCDRFKACGNIDAIAEDVVFIDDDIADVYSNTEFDSRLRQHVGIWRSHRTLNFHGTTRGIDHAGEFHQHPVTGRLNNATAMRSNCGIDEGFSCRLEPSQRAFLVGLHQATIAGDIRRQNSRKPSLHPLFRQTKSPIPETELSHQSMPGSLRARPDVRFGSLADILPLPCPRQLCS